MDARVEDETKTAHPAPDEADRPDQADAAKNEKPERKPADGGDPSVAPDGDGAPERPNVLKRHPGWFALGALAVAVVGVASYFAWLVFFHPYESTDDAFVDARSYTVAPKVSGYVVETAVTDNQHVEAGALLFRVDERDFTIAVAQAEAQREAAEAAVANANAQIEQQKSQVDVARAQLAQAQASLAFAQQDADRYKDLAKSGAGSIQREEQTRSTLQQQQATGAQAQASVVSAQKQVGSLEAQRANAVAQLDQAKSRVEQAKLDLSHTVVKAAQPGRIVRLTGSRGQFAQAGTGLATFVPDEIWVTANFKETQVADMRPGQHVDVVIDAYPGLTITGRVDSVQPGSGAAFSLLPAENATGNYVKVVQRIPVKIVVDRWPDDVAIGPGMSVVPTVRVR